MSKWQPILLCAGISYALRAFPLLVLRRFSLTEEHKISRFFHYASYSVIGGIISSTLYGERFYDNIGGLLERGQIFKFLAVGIAFLASVRTKSIIKSLGICLCSYLLLCVLWIKE